MADQAKGSILKDISLLVIGAVISLTTAIVTDIYNANREDSKILIQRKLDLNEKLSKDLGKKLYLSWELYKGKRDQDTSVRTSLALFMKSKEEWNTNYPYYESLLNFYYGESIQTEFIKDIYNPETKFGLRAVSNDTSKYDYYAHFKECEDNNIKFINKLYQLAKK